MRYLAIALLLTPGCFFYWPPGYSPSINRRPFVRHQVIYIYRDAPVATVSHKEDAVGYQSKALPNLREFYGPRVEAARKVVALKEKRRQQEEERFRQEIKARYEELLHRPPVRFNVPEREQTDDYQDVF